MKKIVLILVACMLCGCSSEKKGEADKPKQSFKTKVTLSDGYEGELERADVSGWNLTLSAPETVKGLGLSYLADGKCVITLENHSAVYERSELPQYGSVDLLVSALDMCAAETGIEVEVKDGKTCRKGNIRGVPFTVVSEEGTPVSAELGTGVKAEFHN